MTNAGLDPSKRHDGEKEARKGNLLAAAID